ncbi:hypothetical protein Dsi01nite_022820 [Dactylosporangium siamense]|uniref:Uncharacterized protein n=1 Tax=Dactylosporangium siamense TaxID=685454 RepID=A0A919PJ87_9ACTN|nr:hypothetical protein Dsi01nite_022820 [Dactylosporangium siamense]
MTRALIRRRVSSETPGAPLRTRDTVAFDTPARAATSAMFNRVFGAFTSRSLSECVTGCVKQRSWQRDLT